MEDSSMFELFKMEVEQQTALLNDSLLALDDDPTAAEHLEASMRASHSIKGAARLLDVNSIQKLAHVMEDCLVAAQNGDLQLSADGIDVLLKGMDTIKQIAEGDENLDAWLDSNQAEYDALLSSLEAVKASEALAPGQDGDTEIVVQSSELSADVEVQTQSEGVLNVTQESSMLALFRSECRQHGEVLAKGLNEIKQDPASAVKGDQLVHAARSIKGAARLVGVDPIAEIATALENVVGIAGKLEVELSSEQVQLLQQALDVVHEIATQEVDLNAWFSSRKQDIDTLLQSLNSIVSDADDIQTDSLSESGGDANISESEVASDLGICFDIQDPSMLELFRVECDQHGAVLSQGLLELEQDPTSSQRLEPLMRAAHSVKGAARLVGIDLVVKLAHAMEDDFVAAQKGEVVLNADQIDVLLKGVDTIHAVAVYEGELSQWFTDNKQDYIGLLNDIDGILQGKKPKATQAKTQAPVQAEKKTEPPAQAAGNEVAAVVEKQELKKASTPQKDRVLRVSAELVNRLMGLAGESLVESRWVYPYSESLRRLKRQQTDLVCMVDSLREHMERHSVSEDMRGLLRSTQKQASYCREIMSDRLAELESYDRRATNLSSRLHKEVVGSRMRPFGDGVHGFPRMVRDISRSLGKDLQLIIEGETTLVDRDILDKIEAPLNHIIRNAIDHGLETAEERAATDKPAKGTIRLSAYHTAGMLSIVVEDDGRGVDLEKLRRKIVDKGLVDESIAATLSEYELMDFLFLPSFSTKDQVSEISGRGVGLDVVHDTVQEMRGNVRATSALGQGTRFQMLLPLTLSVIPALLVEIAGEPYAFPLARIDRIARINQADVIEAEGNQFIVLDGKNVGLVSACQILEKEQQNEQTDNMSIIVLNERNHYYGMVVNKFLGERELVVQVMPEALGKVQDISSAALMEDGSPLLIVDIDDLIRSIEKVLKVARLGKVSSILAEEVSEYKRVLVVDDSITVREVERKLLESAGYEVQTAVDGVDGLNMLRSQPFDMLVTDVDMPRMNGLDLVKTIRQDGSLRSIPVLMVSYKDREEDKLRGLEAGADYYLTKGSFHDETLLQAVVDLVGEAKS